MRRSAVTFRGLAGRLRRGADALADDLLTQRAKITVAVLAALGLAIRHAWLTAQPVTAGDWHWPSPGRLAAWWPWPTIWDSTLGFQGQNRFLDVFRFPVFALGGLVGAAGGTWTLAEKVIYFIPYAVLLPVVIWLLAREILGRTRWALLAPVLLLGNTYFMLEGNGHVPLTLAAIVGCLALIAFLRALRRLSATWALASGLLVSVEAVLDIRPAVITVGLFLLYFVVLIVVEPGGRIRVRRLGLSALSGGAFVITQMYWIVPFLTYHGHKNLPTPSAPNFNIITLGHGIAGVSPAWSGGSPAALVQAPLNPMFLLLPLLAFLPLAARRVRPELLWLAVSAVICAFLAKTNTPPLGGLYNWLYLHFPGFRLFREGSKFLFPVSVGYAVLAPAGLQAAYEWSRRHRNRIGTAVRVGAVLGVMAVVLVVVSTVSVLERGQLGSTTIPTTEPVAFSKITKIVNADRQPGSILWFGSPVYTTPDQTSHRYVITSSTHALVNLTGIAEETMVNRRDPLQFFCSNIAQPYCYVQPGLFPYLAFTAGARYIVSPGGDEMGSLPPGVTRSWLRQELTGLFGTPTQLGGGATSLFVWRLSPPPPAIGGYPAVALVDSGPWSAASVSPALQAMDIPAAYRQTFDKSDFPAAPADLPDAVTVVPRFDDGCQATTPLDVGIMAQGSGVALDAVVGGSAEMLPLLARSANLAGWGIYGPVALSTGFTAISVAPVAPGAPALPVAPVAPAALPAGSPGSAGTAATRALGPCVQWSPRTAGVLGVHPQDVGPARVSAHGERIHAPVTAAAPAWIELRRSYDSGWRLGGERPTTVADGLFNLYHDPAVSHGEARFTFSTLRWEHIGQLVSGAGLLAAIAAFWLLRRRRRTSLPGVVPAVTLESPAARLTAALGLSVLALTAIVVGLQWFGAPSRFPQLVLGSDPYTFDQVLGGAALALLLIAVLLQLARQALSSVVATRSFRGHGRALKALGVTAALSLLLASCGGGAGGATALANAQAAGAPSQFTVGASLGDARQQAEVTQPEVCIHDYTIALHSFPDLASAYDGRANCYLSASIDPAAAVHDDSRAISLSPENPGYYLDRAIADTDIGDINASVRDYQRAVAISSVSPSEILTAVDGLITLEELNAAQGIAEEAAVRLPTSALIRVAQADVAVAIDEPGVPALFAQALALAGSVTADEALVLAHQCGWLVLQHDYDAAVTTCSRAALISIDGSGAYDNLAAAQAALGQLNAANTDLSAAVGAFEGSVGPAAQPAGVDGFGLANLLEAQGRLAVERHQPAGAIAAYRRAKAVLPPGSPDFAARLKADVNAAKQD